MKALLNVYEFGRYKTSWQYTCTQNVCFSFHRVEELLESAVYDTFRLDDNVPISGKLSVS